MAEEEAEAVRSDLRDYFAGRLPARLAELEDAFDEVRAAGWARRLVDEILKRE